VTPTRLAAAAVGLAVVVPALVWGGVAAVDVLVAVSSLWCLAEYAGMAFPSDRAAARVFVVWGWALAAAAALFGGPSAVLAAAGLVTVGALVFATVRTGVTLDGAADRAGRALLGVGWVGLLLFIPLVRREPDGLAWVFVVLVASWLGDTGGYFTGRAFGRHALYPKVSPKKTWEGAIGGITLATVGLLVVRELGLNALSVTDALVLGPVLCTAGIVGDLAESMVKRSFQVKDSGWVMPGHGGLLDRVDSVLFVAPAVWLWVVVL
jgi:phosphatidate cytidylyltransferase